MPVTFVYRSNYLGPRQRHLRSFESESVLEWFQKQWTALSTGDPHDAAEAVLGTSVYGFNTLGGAIAEHELGPPTSVAELEAILKEHLYVEGTVDLGDHHLQVLTNDDEIEVAYYFWDAHFDAAHPGRSDFLRFEGWELPHEVDPARPAFESTEPTETLEVGGGEGRTWLTWNGVEESCNLTESMAPAEFVGARLAEFFGLASGDRDLEAILAGAARRLEATEEEPDFGNAPFQLEDFLEKVRGAQDDLRFVVHPHLIQVAIGEADSEDFCEQWIIFDDVWARSHPQLAEGAMVFTNRWDVLTDGDDAE